MHTGQIRLHNEMHMGEDFTVQKYHFLCELLSYAVVLEVCTTPITGHPRLLPNTDFIRIEYGNIDYFLIRIKNLNG